MKDSDKILDIENREKCFENITDKINLLHEAFRAITMDYQFHLENFWGGKHKIITLRENIDFRLFSSKFHLELLLRQYYIIENQIRTYYKKDPKIIFRNVYPINPLYAHFQNEVSSIFDSIIFHLASTFDYLSGIINFIINNKDESITKWSNLNTACRQNENFKDSNVAKEVLEKHNDFVNKLYIHRSRLIHEKSDVHPIGLEIELESGELDLNFFARKELTRNFSELRKESKTKNITITYVSEWLIEKTIDGIIEILISLSQDIKSKSSFPNNNKTNKPVMFYKNPETGIAESIGDKMWEGIKEKINSR